jgi:peroxiredoxin Q/BCP
MPAKELREGLKAPAFRAKAHTGETVASKDLADRWKVLFFYPKASTSGCTKEARAFQEAKGKFTRRKTAILGISRDGEKANGNFAAKYGLKFPLLCDTDVSIHDKYGVMKEKVMYGKKRLGVDRSTFLIAPDGRIAKMWRGVKVAGHVDDVYAALKEAQAAK